MLATEASVPHRPRSRAYEANGAKFRLIAGDTPRAPPRRYRTCGIRAQGFARARCGQCGHDFRIAFSCTGRALFPACNTRRMVDWAAQLTLQGR